MVKKPMTTEDLFNKICAILKEKGKLPDILDYGLGAYRPVPIRTYEFDLKSNLAYGGGFKKKRRVLKKYPQVVVRDNAAREEKKFLQEA